MRSNRRAGRPARWIEYIAVPDVAAAGGRVLAPARSFPRRGIHAIIADPTGGTFGLVQYLPGAESNDATVPAGTTNPNP